MTSDAWAKHFRLGRLQVELRLLRHRYQHPGDRWIFQPSFVWDRKGKR